MKRTHYSRRSGSSAVKIIAFCTVVAGLYLAQAVLLPVAIAVLLAFALTPIVRRLERVVPSRQLAIGVTIGVTALLSAVLLTFAIGQAREFIAKSPEYRSALTERLRSTRAGAAAIQQALHDVQTAAEVPPAVPSTEPEQVSIPLLPPPVAPRASAPPSEQSTTLIDVAGQTLHGAAMVVITTLLAAVVLLHREDLRDRLVRILGVESLPLTRQTLDDASQRISRYLLTQAGLNLLCGAFIAGGLAILGVPNAALLGIMAGLLRFVPYLGPIAATFITFLTALATSPDWTTPLIVLGLFAMVEAAISLMLEPWLYGKGAGLSLFGVVVAISFWGWLWGVAGLLVAVPLTVCVVLLARHFPALEPLSVLLGDAPPLTPAERFHHRLLSHDLHGARAALTQMITDAEAPSEAVDELWFSSLRRAAVDIADGRLDEPGLDTYIKAARDVLTPQSQDDAISPSPDAAGASGTVIIFSSSNRLDLLAAEIFRTAIARRGNMPVRLIEPPVMLAELLGSEEIQKARALVVLSVVRTSRRRARLLARTLRSRIPTSQVILGAPTRRRAESSTFTRNGIRYVHNAAELFQALGIADPIPTSTSNHEQNAIAAHERGSRIRSLA